MRRFTRLAVIVLALTISLPAVVRSDAEGGKGAEKEVRQATAQFYIALNAMFTGDLEPMKKIWSHAEDVTYMGPSGGFVVGWAAVRADWEKQAAMKLDGRVKPENMRITIGDVIAVVHNYERGENVDPEGKPLSVSIRATNVFRKEGGKWLMIGHHVDTLPYLKK